LLVKRVFFLLNAAFAMAILDIISRVHLPSFVNMLPKYLTHSTFSSCFWSNIIVTGDGCLEILITFVFPTFIYEFAVEKKKFNLLKAAVAMVNLDLNPRTKLASYVIKPSKYLKYSTLNHCF